VTDEVLALYAWMGRICEKPTSLSHPSNNYTSSICGFIFHLVVTVLTIYCFNSVE
jgi:hypothetical protein